MQIFLQPTIVIRQDIKKVLILRYMNAKIIDSIMLIIDINVSINPSKKKLHNKKTELIMTSIKKILNEDSMIDTA